MLDLTLFTRFITPVIAAITIVFNLLDFIRVARRRHRAPTTPGTFPRATVPIYPWVTIWSCALCIAWFTPLCVTIYEANVEKLGRLIAQTALIGVEICVAGAMAGRPCPRPS
ncbi:hypothetical protein Hypma_011089 [Hypsizygus marmoreus]|uniref:Uncharacterized protein n=1 Tax=Hypsizygus marmoreus TaxID=39966 RepID=A0A369JKT2_HYPMA|nr:hypothetical protein Hypma_011089 [Hypsizygus marmoreus]